jgi:putative DNA primase/helicase
MNSSRPATRGTWPKPPTCSPAGRERARQAAGGLRETASFSLLFQSNGEIGLTQFLEENQERAYAGQEVRFCELPADAGAGFGCWDVLHGLPDGARFSETLQRNAAKHYGTAYPEFIRRVIGSGKRCPLSSKSCAAPSRPAP